MAPYEIFLRSEAIEALSGIRGVSRKLIVVFIDSLASDPLQAGDYSVQDSTGRDICIKILGSYAVTYWADHPVKEIRITDIRSADHA
jgi:hypothetical protein